MPQLRCLVMPGACSLFLLILVVVDAGVLAQNGVLGRVAEQDDLLAVVEEWKHVLPFSHRPSRIAAAVSFAGVSRIERLE